MQSLIARAELASYLLMQRLWSHVALALVLVTSLAFVIGPYIGNGWAGIGAAALFTAGSILCFAVLRQDLPTKLPLNVVFFCFISGYLMKYIDRGLAVATGEIFSSEYSAIPAAMRLIAYDKDHMLQGFFLAGLGLLALGLAAALIPVSRVPSRRLDLAQVDGLGRACWPLLLGCVSLGVVLSVVSARLNIGVMHMEQQALPFKLTGVINYTRSAIPLCLILVLLLSWEKRARALGLAAGGAILFYALMISLSTGSRGSFLVPVIFAMLFAIIYNKVSRRGVVIFSYLVVFYSVLRLVLSQYRDYMVEVGGTPTALEAVKFFIYSVGDVASESSLSDIWRMLFSIVDRVQGLDGLLFLTLESPKYDLSLTLQVFTNEYHLGRYMTDDLMGFPAVEGRTHGAAPGMVGALYFLGGIPAIVVGVGVFSAVMQRLYYSVLRRALWIQPILLAFIAYISFQLFSEGNLGTILKDQLFAIALFCGLEFYFRRVLGPPPSRNLQISPSLRLNVGAQSSRVPSGPKVSH